MGNQWLDLRRSNCKSSCSSIKVLLEKSNTESQEGTRMICAEAHPQSSIEAKILIGGGLIEPDPGVSGDVAFEIYRIYYRKLKQDFRGTLTKTYIFYLCGELSDLHCVLPVGSAGVRLLSMIPDSCASDSDLDSLVLNLPLYLCLERARDYSVRVPALRVHDDNKGIH